MFVAININRIMYLLKISKIFIAKLDNVSLIKFLYY